MDKQQSDHIEDRFRQAADNFMPPLNEEAWKRMEVLLDKDPGKRKSFIWWWLSGLLFLIAGSAMFRYYLNNGEESKLKKEAVTVQVDRKPTANYDKDHAAAGKQHQVTTTLPEDGLMEENKGSSRKNINEDNASGSAAQPDLKLLTGNRTKAYVIKSVGKKGGMTGTRATAIYSRFKKDQYRTRREALKNTVQQNSVEAKDLAATSPVFSYQHAVYVIYVGIPDSVLKRPHSELVLQDSLQQAINDALKKTEKQEPQLKKWYLVAALGKNATNLQKFGTKNVGTVIGGEAGYHVNSFLSIQAGFYAGKKIYFAGPADYKAKPGTYWSNPNVKIMKVDADCYIFDLPLSVRADLLHTSHRALYALAGLSSSVTKKENYTYHYSYNNIYRKSAANYKGNVDWFSSADFSIGFEQKLSKTFYLQVEPYAKLPISGIGEGKVKLYSLGIQLGLKYQPLKRR